MINFSHKISESTRIILSIVWRMVKLLLTVSILVVIPIVTILISKKVIYTFVVSNYLEYIKCSISLILGIVIGVLINIKTKRGLLQVTNDEGSGGWRKKDWIWLTGVLTVTILLVLTGWLAKKQILSEHFSFGANLVSITLGLIAIFYAFNQTTISMGQNTKLESTLSDINLKVAQLSSLKENLINMDSKIVEHYDSILDAIEKVEENSANTTENGNINEEKVLSELEDLRSKIMNERRESIANLSKKAIYLNRVYSNVCMKEEKINTTNYKITYDTGKKFDFIKFENNLLSFIDSYSFKIGNIEHSFSRDQKRILILSLKGKGKNNVDIIRGYIKRAGVDEVKNIDIRKI